MGLLNVTQQAIDQAKRPEEGWYEVEIVKVEDEMSKPDPKKPSKKPSLNCWWTIQFVRNLQDGTDMESMQKMKKVFAFNYEYFAMAGDLICAALDIPSLEVLVGKQASSQDLFEGRRLFAQVKHTIWNDKPSWDFSAFSPISQVPF